MDTRDLTKVLVKLFGLGVAAYAVFDLPAYFLGPYDGSAPLSLGDRIAYAVAAQLLPIVFGALLWFLPGTVCNRIVSGPTVGTTSSGLHDFERVALTLLGVWLSVNGVVEALSALLRLYFTSRERPDLPLQGQVFMGPAAALIKTSIGVALVIGAPGIQRLVERLRGRP